MGSDYNDIHSSNTALPVLSLRYEPDSRGLF